MSDNLFKAQAREVLEKAREKIEDPLNWWNFKNPRSSSKACCMIQAVQRVGAFYIYSSRAQSSHAQYDAEDYLRQVTGGNVVEFNEAHEHAECLEAYDKAIALTFTS